MTTDENKCCIELAKELKELGVPQESVWYWMEVKEDCYEIRRLSPSWIHVPKYSAFTVAESMKKLPEDTRLYRHDNLWICISPKEGGGWHQQADEKIGNVPALMLILLIKAKIINPKELKS